MDLWAEAPAMTPSADASVAFAIGKAASPAANTPATLVSFVASVLTIGPSGPCTISQPSRSARGLANEPRDMVNRAP